MHKMFKATYTFFSPDTPEGEYRRIEMRFPVMYQEMEYSVYVMNLENAFRTAKKLLSESMKNPKYWLLVSLEECD